MIFACVTEFLNEPAFVRCWTVFLNNILDVEREGLRETSLLVQRSSLVVTHRIRMTHLCLSVLCDPIQNSSTFLQSPVSPGPRCCPISKTTSLSHARPQPSTPCTERWRPKGAERQKAGSGFWKREMERARARRKGQMDGCVVIHWPLIWHRGLRMCEGTYGGDDLWDIVMTGIWLPMRLLALVPLDSLQTPKMLVKLTPVRLGGGLKPRLACVHTCASGCARPF